MQDFTYITKLPEEDAIKEYQRRYVIDTLSAFQKGFNAGWAGHNTYINETD